MKVNNVGYESLFEQCSRCSWFTLKLALSFYSLERLEGGQQGIEGFFGNGATAGTSSTATLKRSRSDSPVVVAPRNNSRKTTTTEASKKSKAQNEIIEILTDSDDDAEQIAPRWTCPKCKRVFTAVEEDAEGEKGAETTQTRLEVIKREHQDFHLAQDLHHQDRCVKPDEKEKPANATHAKKVRRPPRKPEGIKAFFIPFDDARKKQS